MPILDKQTAKEPTTRETWVWVPDFLDLSKWSVSKATQMPTNKTAPPAKRSATAAQPTREELHTKNTEATLPALMCTLSSFSSSSSEEQDHNEWSPLLELFFHWRIARYLEGIGGRCINSYSGFHVPFRARRVVRKMNPRLAMLISVASWGFLHLVAWQQQAV